jgi:putative membrane protein
VPPDAASGFEAGPDGPVTNPDDRQGREVTARDIDYRFVLANERTFLAWVRTSLGLVAGGVALDQFVVVGPDHEILGPLSIGVILLGAAIALIGTVRWSRVDTAMRSGRPLNRSSGIMIIGIAVACVALVIGAMLALG